MIFASHLNIQSPELTGARFGIPLRRMIHLTDKAVEAIRRLAAEKAGEGQLMRLSIKSGGCSGLEYAMEFATPADTDESFRQDDLEYLVDR